jgi:alcohol dehydrogenase (cytochrome c)
MWQQGGATVGAWITYDPELNLLYYGTADPGVWNPDMRPGDTNLLYYGTADPGVWNPDMRPGDTKWSSTILARNPDSGKAIWAYQLTPHDNWDYDAVNKNIVADIAFGTATKKVILHFNKNGFAYMLDRATGQLLNANVFAPSGVTWSTGVDVTSGLPALVPAMQTHQGIQTRGTAPPPAAARIGRRHSTRPLPLCFTSPPSISAKIWSRCWPSISRAHRLSATASACIRAAPTWAR